MAAVKITRATGRMGRVIRSSLSIETTSRNAPGRVLLEELQRDHHLLNLGRAFVDLGDARIAPVPLDVELAQVPVAAVHLRRQMRAARGGLRSVPFGDRGFLGVRPAQVTEPRRAV